MIKLSQNVNDDKELLERLIKKILNHKVTRNIDKILQEQNISHYKISNDTGRNNNWFNRTFNEVEDMRISTFTKIISVINKVITQKNKNSKVVEINNIFDEEILQISLLLTYLKDDDLNFLVKKDKEISNRLFHLESNIGMLKNLNNVISQEEIDAYNRLVKSVNHKENENGRT